MTEYKNLLETPGESFDILLIQCPPWDIKMPPLGIAYLSTYLRKYEYKTYVFDLNVMLYNLVKNDTKSLWEQKNYDRWVNNHLFKNTWFQLKDFTTVCVYETLKKVSTDYIGLSVNFASIKFAVELIKIIKYIKMDIKIILGGWGCINAQMRSMFPKELVEAFVVGEGEETLREIIEALKMHKNSHEIPGSIFIKDPEATYKPRQPIMNLDTIPWPTFNEFQLDRYSEILPLFTSRGCIGSCSFCNDWCFSKPYRFRSANNVFEEIKYHTQYNRITTFSFKDLLCNGNIERLNQLSDLIINSGIKVKWDSQAIPRKEMTYKLLCKLKKAGCDTLIYGVESFSNNVLKKMRKLFTKEIAERVIVDTYRAGIKTFINIIVGFPGETEQDFQETINAIKRNYKYIGQIGAISVCLVNGDSDLEIHSKDYGIILSSDAYTRAKEWYSADGRNTYNIRRKRAETILDLINQLKLSYETITM